MRHQVMDLMFENPTILEELDILFKDETARRMMLYYQPEEEEQQDQSNAASGSRSQVMETVAPGKKILFTTDGSEASLSNVCIYFLRLSTKKYLGEETFQVIEKYHLCNHTYIIDCLEGSHWWNDWCLFTK